MPINHTDIPTIDVPRAYYEQFKKYFSYYDQQEEYIQLERKYSSESVFIRLKPMIDDVYRHPTEEKFPEMTTRFREIIEEMYQTFLKKNNDYSRWNILATGIVGITTRFWDKTARIMNLVGFNIGTGEYTGPKENMVTDEKIEQTFLDASVYGIIARIYIEGKWGK